MSIEKQLSEAFKHNEVSLHCPPSLDNRIMAEYEQAVMNKGSNVYMMKKRRLPKVALIALVVALLCGFAYGSKLLFSDSTNQLSYQFNSSEAFHLNAETFEHARATLQEVKTQLAPGEAGIVYMPEIFKDYPLYGVTNPDYIADKQQWELVLEEHGLTEQLPDSLLEGAYSFKAGAVDEYPLISLEQNGLLAEMEAEKKTSNNDQPVWRLSDSTTNPIMTSYISVYEDENEEAIRLSWQIYDEVVSKINGFTSPTTEYEEYDLNGKKVHYTKNNQSLYTESDVLQSAMWMVEKDGQSFIYTIESDSPSMTKEKLIDAVKSLP